jgi:hypothetical protein
MSAGPLSAKSALARVGHMMTSWSMAAARGKSDARAADLTASRKVAESHTTLDGAPRH